MSYSTFTLESVGRLLGVVARPADLLPNLRAVPAPLWLQEQLERGTQGVHLSLISEKSRSEFIVAPILLATRELSGNRVAIYSGQTLDADESKGLTGECDFILSAADAALPLQTPIAVVVEAKKNDVEGGLGQCIAQMVGADRFNQTAGRTDVAVFGCVTTGETWQFLRLEGTVALMERRRFYIDQVDMILGAFQAIVNSCLGNRAAASPVAVGS